MFRLIKGTGSSLIEVSDGVQKGVLQRITKGTPGWRAPNQKGGSLLDASALRGVDLYSYGLLVWSVMLNGTQPWKVLAKEKQRIVLSHTSSQQPNEPSTELSADDFDSFKQADREEMVYQLARQSLEGGHPGDVDMHTIRQVLQWTLQGEPDNRATNFNEIIAVLEDRGGWFK